MDLTLEHAEYANEAFYLAFESRDVAAMDHLWAEAADVVCLHPGWPMLRGRKAIMESWEAILTNPRQGPVSVFGAEPMAWAPGVFAVCCYEQAGGDAVMIATNVFVTEQERLRMVSHQAGYCANPPESGR